MKKATAAYIVDDDSIYVYSLKKLIALRKFCDDVTAFSNGADAIDALKNANTDASRLPDIILLDINMPVMDGWDFLSEFEQIQPQLKKQVTIYMVSSSIDHRDLKRARAINTVKDYIIKPVTLTMLAEIFGTATVV